ncbi:NAD+ synthase [Thermospira aquatica]|uniref:Glutamine-dependent NAD(+) synthetase n=1 Tax=Thermospira aquatica TaxID=2828656 RepID=A0AAX3BFX1_9SPIR|nr:NAD+ synthase [Thermospira aquatica]URA11302.1 NAD+ synthase [Thermospira aquatica]
MSSLRIALCQVNPTVGDIHNNTEKILSFWKNASHDGAHIAVFPELCLPGYPPEDLLYKTEFLQANLAALNRLVESSQKIPTALIVGFIDQDESGIYNAAALIANGEIIDIYHKIFLPNYGVFDEKRYFNEGKHLSVCTINGIKTAISICEDIWYPDGPMHFSSLIEDVQVVFNLSASPFHKEKPSQRERMLTTRASDENTMVVMVNAVGGQDELVFDGHSCIIGPKGNIVARLKAFEEDYQCVDVSFVSVLQNRLKDARRRQQKLYFQEIPLPWTLHKKTIELSPSQKKPAFGVIEPQMDSIALLYKALVVGTRDYVEKNGFKEVIVGISGGIDSALVATIATDALGEHRVHGIFLPTRFSADISREDSFLLAKNLGIDLKELSIEGLFGKYLEELQPFFHNTPFGIAEENLQSRIRGNIVMALSNKFGYLVLTTGNKSEMSTGYATLYGDMAGGFAVIKDVLKTEVYALAHYRNSITPVIPQRILERPPTAELRPDQKDTDTLPPYEILDRLIQGYVEEDLSFEDLCHLSPSPEIVKRVIRLIDTSEYKRRQAPPGIKVSVRAFGKDRRMPITNRFQPTPPDKKS